MVDEAASRWQYKYKAENFSPYSSSRHANDEATSEDSPLSSHLHGTETEKQAKDDTIQFKDQETQHAYKVLLGFVREVIGDQPSNVLYSAVDEILIILKNDHLDNDDCKHEIEILLRCKISDERFDLLVHLSKKVSNQSTKVTPGTQGEIDMAYGVNTVVEHSSNVNEEVIFKSEEAKIECGSQEKNIDETTINPSCLLNLEDITRAQESYFMMNKNIRLPDGSCRQQMKEYEVVLVPALKPPPRDDFNKTFYRITDLPKYVQPAFEHYIVLNRIQTQLVKVTLESDENILLCAPTGIGKTYVALLCILREIGKHVLSNGCIDTDKFKIIYIVPICSLIQDMVHTFTRRLKSYGIRVLELNDDHQLCGELINEAQLIICTPEKWDIFTRKNNEGIYIHLIHLIIIDDIHSLYENCGPAIEAIIARTHRFVEISQEDVRFVGLSTTFSNYEDIATFLNVKREGIFHFDNSYRPTPRAQQYISITETNAFKQYQIMNDLVYQKVMEHAGKNQILIFVHSPEETGKTARTIRDACLEKKTIDTFIKPGSASFEILREEVKQINNLELKDLLPYSFAILHTDMTRSERVLIEDLFSERHIQVLVTMASLAWHISLPALTVIIKGTQMFGHYGKPMYDICYQDILMTSHNELQYYMAIMNQQLSVESHMISKLADNLNAEIVLGNVGNVREGAEWLSFTFLYVRMIKAPHLYGVAHESLLMDKYLLQRRIDLIHSAAIQLDESLLIRYDRKLGTFQMTQLGRIASHNYCAHKTIAMYSKLLKPNFSEQDLFRIVSLSTEFLHMRVREEEESELQKLRECVPIPIKESINEPSAKINILLQAHISQMKLDGYTLMIDMIYIAQKALRLMRAIFEIALQRQWAQLAVKTLNLSKTIDKQMWQTMCPLRQYK